MDSSLLSNVLLIFKVARIQKLTHTYKLNVPLYVFNTLKTWEYPALTSSRPILAIAII